MRICIEGNIGAGKSTVLRRLAEEGLHVIPEPVEEWSQWLREFYSDRKRWAFAFQMKVLLSFLTKAHPESPLVIYERSPLSTRFVFGQLLYNDGCFTENEWELYKSVCESYAWTPDAIVYVRVDPETALSRIRERDRDGEGGIDMDYIRKINFQYNIMMKYDESQRVFEVDGNRDSEQVAQDVLSIVRSLT
jgi:deoxyadenosine/deoxycytidine kinase